MSRSWASFALKLNEVSLSVMVDTTTAAAADDDENDDDDPDESGASGDCVRWVDGVLVVTVATVVKVIAVAVIVT